MSQDVHTNWPEGIQVLVDLSHFMLVFNSSINFYIYKSLDWMKRRNVIVNDEQEELKTLATNTVDNIE